RLRRQVRDPVLEVDVTTEGDGDLLRSRRRRGGGGGPLRAGGGGGAGRVAVAGAGGSARGQGQGGRGQQGGDPRRTHGRERMAGPGRDRGPTPAPAGSLRCVSAVGR